MKEKKTAKERFEEFKFWVKEKSNKVYNFCVQHKETLIVLIPVFVSGSIELVKIVARSRNVNADKYLKENYIYDRSCGHYYELKRQPKSSEWRLIDQRKAEGELLGDILADMRILK